MAHPKISSYLKEKYLSSSRNGQITIILAVFFTVIMILSGVVFKKTADFLSITFRSIEAEQATNLAEAGVDYALWALNTRQTPSLLLDLGNGQIELHIEPDMNSPTKIIATGYFPTKNKKIISRTVQVGIEYASLSESIPFSYAAQVGAGNILMEQSATINGNVYSNGNIEAGNGNQQTINGEAYAVGTIDSPPINVTTNVIEENQPLKELPTIDYQLWRNQAVAGGVETTNCTISSATTIGPKKYDCDLLISTNAQITLLGPVWVTGNFSISQGGTVLKLDDSYGSSGTVLLVDGTVNLTQGGAFAPTNASPKGYILLATTSSFNPAITLSQSGATALFYALNGGATLSQSANVASLVSQNLTLTNSATLTYDTNLELAEFALATGNWWQIVKGTVKYTK